MSLKPISYTIYTSTHELPKNWNETASGNIFLEKSYLKVLEKSAPTNMKCLFIGIFEQETLLGIVLAQFLEVNKLESFGERDQCIKTTIRNFVFKRFASNVLILGNNMITGQNMYAFNRVLDPRSISELLWQCSKEIVAYFKKKNTPIHLVCFKDFHQNEAVDLKKHHFKPLFHFDVQPNMVFELNPMWKQQSDYVADFSKKYRNQYKRASHKFTGITIKELGIDEILQHEERIYELYHHVAKNAPFNTFFLAKHHFSTFKKELSNQFLIYGYFLNEKLIGFHTLLLNGEILETYFLGYDKDLQKDKMLYLNMLYTMTEFGIKNNFKKIIFGRTALEIKSSIGAQPETMSGFIFHTNTFINRFIGKIFNQLEPKTVWQQRHPFV